MSLALTALLPASPPDSIGGAYEVTGTTGSFASRWKHRCRLYPVVVTSLTGASQWRLALDDGAFTWPSPIDSTGTVSPLNLGVLDLSGLAQGHTLHARARLENTPASATSIGTCAISAGSPIVVTKSSHGLTEGDVVKFTTTGALPGALVVGTAYYLRAIDTGTFHLAATEGGALLNFTTGAGSGTHTLTLARAVSAWQSTANDVTTGDVLTAVPVITTPLITGLQIYPIDTTTMSIGWNSYPAEYAQDIVGTSVAIQILGLAGGTAGLTVDGLANFAQVPLGGFTDGEEVDVIVWPLIAYPVDGSGLFVATGGVDTAIYSAPTELRTHAAGLVGTPDDLTPLAGASPLQLTLGVPAAGTVQYLGSGAVQEWTLAEAPAGLTISAPSPAHRLGILGGTPTEEGIFAARVACRSLVGYVPTISTLELAIYVTGRLCLGWLHTDPLALDLQFLQRTRAVVSYRFPSGPIELVRGDTLTVYVILRTGPISGTNYGPLADPSTFRDLRLVIRPENDLDGEPYLVAVAERALAVLATFTAATSDLLTVAVPHGLFAGDRVQVSSTVTLPAGLAAATDYYVLPASLGASTLKVSDTAGGSAIDITDTGTGVHTLRAYRALAVTTIAGHPVIALAVTVQSETLDDQFAVLDESPGPDPAELALNGLGELVYTTAAGGEVSSRKFEVLLTQDVAR